MDVRGVRSFAAAVVGAAVATSRIRQNDAAGGVPAGTARRYGEHDDDVIGGTMLTVLQTAGRGALRAWQVLAGVLTSLGSGGVVPPGHPPTTATKKPDEYRP